MKSTTVIPPTAERLRESTERLRGHLDKLEGTMRAASRRRAVYMAHPLNAPTRDGIEANRKEAARWAAFLARHFDVAPECSWIVLTGEWEETPENRQLGIDCDLALVARCQELVMVGPRVSSGMLAESQEALRLGIPVYDLTGLSRDQEEVALAWHERRVQR